ncbi:low molecular weight protein tyrosine phosphatase family protein [Rhizobium halophytocola]|uniref:Phosphotyrosine protein phosphatase I domain-containing protein n=1 Tax=Rhizobium halophytocola TaxID=735519 RepID=A0ABS4E1C2_9HYPH|nr:putative protein tyrosine phosphatase [Rhizobium halophytocola]
MKNVLFVRSQNRLRSPTAEQVFAGWPGIEVPSARTDNDAENPLSAERVDWADIILVMARGHRSKLQGKCRPRLKDRRIICLNISDDCDFMDPALVERLRERVPRHL